MKPKITLICIDPKRTPISVLYISLDLNKNVTLALILNHTYISLNIYVEGGEKDIFENDIKYKLRIYIQHTRAGTPAMLPTASGYSPFRIFPYICLSH